MTEEDIIIRAYLRLPEPETIISDRIVMPVAVPKSMFTASFIDVVFEKKEKEGKIDWEFLKFEY